ncbi:MAG: M14 family zinc carboxypeptidase [Gemmatimonadaceae bacterium]
MNRLIRIWQFLVLGVIIAACARSISGVVRGRTASVTPPCCAMHARAISERHRVAAISTRKFTHAQLWTALEPIIRRPDLAVQEIGRSVQGRPIRAITYGTGPVNVLLWSQMHGDESTATMALADLMSWFAGGAAIVDPLRNRIASRLKVVMVPMLNPDGAELFQRENAVGVDINRDARSLVTPEARALKALRDSIKPEFGFNLHDQNARTLSEGAGRQVAIALLAPTADEERTYGPARTTARLVAAEIASVLEAEIPGRIAKYNDAFEPRAFGDLMQQWGTSTVLIESGALPNDPEKQRLRALNVAAILSALDAIATERHLAADPAVYDALPTNARAAVDVLVRGGSIVLPGAEPLRVDVALNYDESLARLRPRVREVGDLASVTALDTVDATGLFLHPSPSMLALRNGMRWIRFDTTAVFTVRRGRDTTSEVVSTRIW